MEKCIINNQTSDNITEQLLIDKARAGYYYTYFPTTVMLIMFCMVGIPGNTIVVLVYLKEKRLSTTKFIIFIIALIDLISSLVAIPCNVISTLFWLEIANVFFCKFRWSLNVAVTLPEIYLIAGVTVVRYCHVCKPSKVYLMESMVKPFCACCLLVGLGLGGVIGACFGCKNFHSVQDKYVPGFRCDPSEKCKISIFIRLIFYFLVLLYISCVCIIITLNSLILKRMLKQQAIMKSYKVQKRKRRKSHRASKLSADNLHSVKNKNKQLLLPIDNDDNITDTPSTKISIASYVSNLLSDVYRQTNNMYTNKKPKSDLDNISSIYNGSIKSIHTSKRNQEDHEKGNDSEIFSCKSEKESCYSKAGTFSSVPGRVQYSNSSTENKKKASIDDVKKGMNIETENKNNTVKDARGSPYDKSCYKKLMSLVKIESWNRTTLKLFVVSVVYVLSYMPSFIVAIYIRNNRVRRSVQKEEFAYLFTPSLYIFFLGSAMNPLIYTFVDPKFRSQCRALFRCK